MQKKLAIPMRLAALGFSSMRFAVTPMVAGGDSHSLALNSSGRVFAWGDNAFGQLGNGAALSQRTPVEVSGLAGMTAVAGGDVHSIALSSDGSVLAWGFNGQGQLGDGATAQRSTPAQVLTADTATGAVALGDVLAIASGINHNIALKRDGTIWAWGHNAYGQLGNNNSTTNSLLALQVQGLTGMSMTAVSAGSYHNPGLPFLWHPRKRPQFTFLYRRQW